MKIVWFTNSVLPAVFRHLGMSRASSGPWMACLLSSLSKHKGISLIVVTTAQGLPDVDFVDDGVRYIVVSLRKKIFHWFVSNSGLTKCAELVHTIKPDLVHIHGTELQYGLLGAQKMISSPVVISIQGLVGKCVPFVLHEHSLWRTFQISRILELVRGTSILHQYYQYKIRGRRESEIIEKNVSFLGRTIWDKANVRSINPSCRYTYCGEILRKKFYKSVWKHDGFDRNSVIFTNASGPLKGVNVLIDALAIVKNSFPQMSFRLAGSLTTKTGYGQFIIRKLKSTGLYQSFNDLGYLNDIEMASYLCKSHVFVLPSQIDNSPNSLAEAQLIGMPCVASYTGGVPSMVEEGQTGLLFPRGDSEVLANRIMELFSNDTLCCELGEKARKVALRRHDPEKITQDLLKIYKEINNNNLNETN